MTALYDLGELTGNPTIQLWQLHHFETQFCFMCFNSFTGPCEKEDRIIYFGIWKVSELNIQ